MNHTQINIQKTYALLFFIAGFSIQAHAETDNILQEQMDTKLSSTKNYDQYKEYKADLAIFSYDRPLQLYALLESVDMYVTNLNSIVIVCRASNEEFKTAYQEVKETFPHTKFLWQNSSRNRRDFKPLTMDAIKDSTSDHVVFAVDDIIITDNIHLGECIYWLEKVDAHGFYLRLGTHLNYCYPNGASQAVPPYAVLDEENKVFAWQFDNGEHDWHYPNTVDLTVYRKKDLIPVFKTFHFTSPNWLEGQWAQRWPERNAGIFYKNSKMINIPLNIITEDANNNAMKLYSTQELLELFEQGLKIDIIPMHQMANTAAHVEYEPTFIER